MELIFHIADATEWQAAVASGSYTRSTRDQSLDEVGYIHCSYAHQVDGVAQRYYRDVTTPHVVLTIDPALVAAPLQVDNGYPHIYGPLNATAVVEVTPFNG